MIVEMRLETFPKNSRWRRRRDVLRPSVPQSGSGDRGWARKCYGTSFLLLYYKVITSQVSRGRLGRLAAWHLPGGTAGLASRWAATSKCWS